MANIYSADYGVPLTSLNAVTGNGAGDAFGIPQKPHRTGRIAFHKHIGGTGSFSALTLNIEGAIDDPTVAANWFVLNADTTTSDAQGALTSEYPVNYVRANQSASTVASGAPTVTVTLYLD